MRKGRPRRDGEQKTTRPGLSRGCLVFSCRYCHLLPYYHHYTIPSLCLCIFPFGHNWGLFCLLMLLAVPCLVLCGSGDVMMLGGGGLRLWKTLVEWLGVAAYPKWNTLAHHLVRASVILIVTNRGLAASSRSPHQVEHQAQSCPHLVHSSIDHPKPGSRVLSLEVFKHQTVGPSVLFPQALPTTRLVSDLVSQKK